MQLFASDLWWILGQFYFQISGPDFNFDDFLAFDDFLCLGTPRSAPEMRSTRKWTLKACFFLGPRICQTALQTACRDSFAADCMENTSTQESVLSHAVWCHSKEGAGGFLCILFVFHVFMGSLENFGNVTHPKIPHGPILTDLETVLLHRMPRSPSWSVCVCITDWDWKFLLR